MNTLSVEVFEVMGLQCVQESLVGSTQVTVETDIWWLGKSYVVYVKFVIKYNWPLKCSEVQTESTVYGVPSQDITL